MKLVSLISACALSLGAAGSAQADVIFNNFGPNYAYATNGGYDVGNSPIFGGTIVAPRVLFTSNGDYSVTQIDLARRPPTSHTSAQAITSCRSHRT